MARSAETICDARTAGSEDATGGSGRGLAVGKGGDGVAVAGTAEEDAEANAVRDGETETDGVLETAHAPSNTIAHAAATRLMTPLARTPRRAREEGHVRARSA
jgi:hypothetical protein